MGNFFWTSKDVIWTCMLLAVICSKTVVQSQDCVSSQADVVFVVDDSTSVQRLNYRLVLRFIQDVVNKSLTIGPFDTQIGFISFSNTVKSQFYFNTFSDKDQLIDKIGRIKYRGGGTNIARALLEAHQKHFQDPVRGAREGAAKVLVLITDGTSTGTDEISQVLRDDGIKILCVGISAGVDLQQLRSIAADDQNVFDASDFSKLGDIAGNLITKTCEAIQPEVNPCDDKPCRNNGTCVRNESSIFTCVCTEMYTGSICEIEINPCDSSPCLHDGICTGVSNTFSCSCQRYYTGENCETEILSECRPNPCFNGMCSETATGFICRCMPGFTGDLCDTEMNPCDSNPCLHDGICTAVSTTFSCSCQRYYTGETCETEILSECRPNPCFNGICSETATGIICRCMPGFTGDLCDTEILPAPCIPNPCQHGGTCRKSGNSITCTCTEMFAGQRCDTGKITPLVAELGETTEVVCSKFDGWSNGVLEITNIPDKRIYRRAGNHMFISSIEKKDAYGLLLCQYTSLTLNTTVSLQITLIVVEKKKESSGIQNQFTCTFFANSPGVNISIQTDSSTDIYSGVNQDTVYYIPSTADPALSYMTTVASYDALHSKSVSAIASNVANVICSVLYRDETVWSVTFPKGKDDHHTDEEGYPIAAWILLGILIVGIIVAVVIFTACRKRCAAACKSHSKDDEQSSKELEQLEKAEKLDDIQIDEHEGDTDEGDEQTTALRS